MKLRRLGSLLVLLVACSWFLSAQSQQQLQPQAKQQTTAPADDADKAIIQAWQEGAQQRTATPDSYGAMIQSGRKGAKVGWPNLASDPIVISPGTLDASCAYMRTYRVKRDSPDSDSTRPAGYTTCVPLAKFRVLLKTAEPRPVAPLPKQ
jgi:hypothetical protein